MADRIAGVVAGLLAGAAGATAHNAVGYLHQVLTSTPAPSSPTSTVPANTAAGAGGSGRDTRAGGAGALGGLGIAVGVGALAGALRSVATTPPQPAAAAALAAAAWGTSLAASTAGDAPRDTSPAGLAVDGLAHLAYGLVTVLTLHRLLDPLTPHARR